MDAFLFPMHSIPVYCWFYCKNEKCFYWKLKQEEILDFLSNRHHHTNWFLLLWFVMSVKCKWTAGHIRDPTDIEINYWKSFVKIVFCLS